jgi:hypothetical protein
MSASPQHNDQQELVYRFVQERIDSVPQLEALLLLWRTRPAVWSERDLATRLFVSPDHVRRTMSGLVREALIATGTEDKSQYWYDDSSPDRNQLLEALDSVYRGELVRITNMIHAKAPTAIREFARAFQFGRPKE